MERWHLGDASRGLRAALIAPLLTGSVAPIDSSVASSPGSTDTVIARDTTQELSEVIVSAERRDADIQKTALAISTIPANSLDQDFVNDIAGLNGLVPSLQTTKTSGFENIVTMRGVGSETPEEAPTTIPGVSLFIDGVYISNTVSLDQTLFDVDRIEVLRGPQGALYGQSSAGGAIRVITIQPKLNQFSASGDFSLGNYNLTRERLGLNVPIVDTVALRVSGQRYDHEGFTRDVAIPGFREDDAHDSSAKWALLWSPASDLRVNLTAQWYHARNHGAAQKNINDPQPDPWSIYQDYPSNFELRTALYHLDLHYSLPRLSIESTTAFQYLKNLIREDASRSAFALFHAYDDVAAWNTTVRNWSEELDLVSKPDSRLEWIVGGFFLRQTTRQFVAEFKGQTPHPDVTVQPDIESVQPSNLAYGNDSKVLRKSYSLFVQGTWHVTSALRLTAGARFNEDTYFQSGFNFSAFGTDRGSHSSLNRVPTFRAEADFDLTAGNMPYMSVARGYKPGGVNGSHGQIVLPSVFEPELNTTFELGLKSLLADRSLRLRVAGFYSIYRNMQYIEDDPVPFGYGIANVPTIHIYGAEAEASWFGLNNHLSINSSFAIEGGKVQGHFKSIDSTVIQAIENAPSTGPCASGGAFYNPACWSMVIAAARDIGGNSAPALPRVSGAINMSYLFNVAGGRLTPAIEYIYRGSEWARIFNEPALDYVPAYGVMNLSLRYGFAHPTVSTSLACTNLFNRAGVNSRYTDPFSSGQTSQQFIAPRQVIFTIGYSF